MNVESLIKSIDMPQRKFSLVLVDPRPAFLEWLERFRLRKGWTESILCLQEENLVVVIPSVNKFSQPGSLEEFLAALKPWLLRAELDRFGIPVSEFEYSLDAASCDLLLDISIRETVALMSDFKQFPAGKVSS